MLNARDEPSAGYAHWHVTNDSRPPGGATAPGDAPTTITTTSPGVRMRYSTSGGPERRRSLDVDSGSGAGYGLVGGLPPESCSVIRVYRRLERREGPRRRVR